MIQQTNVLQCPHCSSDLLVWRGVENENRQNDQGELDRNPAAMVHRWQCMQCSQQFKQRLE